jgi:hypothetical protein
MTFSPNKIDTVNVIIAKSPEDIESFFDDSIDASSGVVLSTGNGNLIQLDHSFGVGIGPDQQVMIRFADSGGQTLQKLFSINIENSIKKAKKNSKQDLFLISYGMGDNREEWSSPGYHYIFNADYEILTDGLEITTLYFSPMIQIEDGVDPIGATDAITKAFRNNVGQVVGEVDDTGAYQFNDMEEVVDSVLNLYRKGAEQVYGLNAVIEMPKEFIKEYINRELTESPPDSPNTLGTDKVGGTAALPEFEAWNVNIDDSSIIYDILDGVPMLAGWHEAKVKALTTLLQLPGIVLTAEDVPVPPPPGSTGPTGPPIGPSSPPTAPAGASPPDAYAATATFVPPPPPPPPVKKALVINLSLNFRHYRESFAQTFSKLFDALRSAGAYPIKLQNASMWDTLGETLISLQPTIFTQNNLQILQQLEFEKKIPKGFSGNSLVIMGDVTVILEKFGAAGTGEAQVTYDMALGQQIGSETKLKPYIGDPLILETGQNILNFKSDTRVPAIGFFKNNTFYKAANAQGTKEEYITFIKNYLQGCVERFSPAEKLVLTEGAVDVFDYDKVAEDLFSILDSKDPDALGNSYIATDSKFGGLLTYLYMYYNYVALGTVFATATTIPYFKYSQPGVLGLNVVVKIRRNPSPYDHLIDKEYNTYNSGLYKLQGWKHSISNSQATSTFHLRRISLK